MVERTLGLVDALRTSTDAGRWPYFDKLSDLHDAGLIPPRVWSLVTALMHEYEMELAALRSRPPS